LIEDLNVKKKRPPLQITTVSSDCRSLRIVAPSPNPLEGKHACSLRATGVGVGAMDTSSCR